MMEYKLWYHILPTSTFWTTTYYGIYIDPVQIKTPCTNGKQRRENTKSSFKVIIANCILKSYVMKITTLEAGRKKQHAHVHKHLLKRSYKKKPPAIQISSQDLWKIFVCEKRQLEENFKRYYKVYIMENFQFLYKTK